MFVPVMISALRARAPKPEVVYARPAGVSAVCKTK